MDSLHYTNLVVLMIQLLLIKKTFEANSNDAYYCQSGQSSIEIKSGTHPSAGKFSSALWPKSYPPSTKCKYQFIARRGERVKLEFTAFNVEGLSDDCFKDYVDIFISIKPSTEDIVSARSYGRFCGHSSTSVPALLISEYQTIVLLFNADNNTRYTYGREGSMSNAGFYGSYQFVPDDKYNFGTPLIKSSDCSFLLDSRINKHGILLSPTYPGVYPNDKNCTYVFRAQKYDRILLSFKEFLLFEFQKTCTIDYVSFYDGDSVFAPRIGSFYCGQKSNLQIYSTRNILVMVFISKSGRNSVGIGSHTYVAGDGSSYKQYVGFLATYTISNQFAAVKDTTLHIPGTECDMIFESGSSTTKEISSPKFGQGYLEANKTCAYFFSGLFNTMKREKIELKLLSMDLPNNDTVSCEKGARLDIYTSVLEAHSRSPPTKPATPSTVLCGVRYPRKILSTRAAMIIVYRSGSAVVNAAGFKATFDFIADFGITNGTMVTPGICNFQYSSAQLKTREGIFNSPFYPNHYPHDFICNYTFITSDYEQVRVTFVSFYVTDKGRMSQPNRRYFTNSPCTEDWLLVYQLLPSARASTSMQGNVRFSAINMVQLCGAGIPGPISSEFASGGLEFRFRSDAKSSAIGFEAHYEFLKKQRLFTDTCGGNITSNVGGGEITSPNYPKRYPKDLICEWHIFKKEKENKLLIQFAEFDVEGSPQSCTFAAVTIYDNTNASPVDTLCGTDASITSYVSSADKVRVRFIVSKQSEGATGFRLVWTELLTKTTTGICKGFQCEDSGFCISHFMECNGLPNCGFYKNENGKYMKDDSDETIDSPECEKYAAGSTTREDGYNLVHIGVAVIMTTIFLILIVLCILYREHRKTTTNKDFHPNGINVSVNHSVAGTLTELDVKTSTALLSSPKRSLSRSRNVVSGRESLTREKMQKVSIV